MKLGIAARPGDPDSIPPGPSLAPTTAAARAPHRESGSSLRVLTGRLRRHTFREQGINRDHVQSLVATGGRWPPILVAAGTLIVVDGVHRVEAALALGLDSLDCELYEGNTDRMYLEFVRRNAQHGLPLSLRDREQAAVMLLCLQPDWSDRRIAEFCAISPHTVAALRAAGNQAGIKVSRPEGGQRRLGRDGKRRPVDTANLHERIAAEIRLRPQGSLREVAAAAGASPETVRTVKRRLQLAPGPAPVEPHAEPADGPDWQEDLALRAMDAGPEFLQWFGRTAVGNEWRDHAGQLPLNRVYAVADEARRRASAWRAFAEALEQRAQAQTR